MRGLLRKQPYQLVHKGHPECWFPSHPGVSPSLRKDTRVQCLLQWVAIGHILSSRRAVTTELFEWDQWSEVEFQAPAQESPKRTASAHVVTKKRLRHLTQRPHFHLEMYPREKIRSYEDTHCWVASPSPTTEREQTSMYEFPERN